jgi:hypothetical protein
VRGSSVTITRSGVVPLEVSCSVDAGAPCRGTLTLVVTRRSVHASAARRGKTTLTIARANFSVAPGKKAKVKAHLSRRGRQLLRRKGSLKVTAKISRRGGPNLGQTDKTVGLTIKKGSRARKASMALLETARSLR